MKVKEKAPLIAITCSRASGGAWGMYSLGHFMDYTFSDYSQAILHSGGAPVIIPAAQDRKSIEKILSAVQGLILSGGPDVHPRRFGEEPLAGLGEVDEVMTKWNSWQRLGRRKNLPVLGICRGIQVLNVALGGTLYQDIPSQVPESICHTPKTDKAVNTHMVRIEARQPTAQALRQARNLGQRQASPVGERRGARAGRHCQSQDGVIEAVEHPGRRFVTGVQWHPEGRGGMILFKKAVSGICKKQRAARLVLKIRANLSV
jgi:putative glutamine amidotransferase